MADCFLIFGGTFDPPHRAHVELPALVAETLGCDRIIYIPAATNPLKRDDPPTDAEHRLAMLRLALRERPRTVVSTIELERGGVSYFVDTLHSLCSDVGSDVELRFLIGADQALQFGRWKDAGEILRLATPAVMLRPPWTDASFRAALAGAHGEDEADRWMAWTVPAPLIDVSATELRDRLRAGGDVSEMLDPAVAAYIREHGLYGL
ncbi:MAG: nicotinate (nicotinamide) nucleotide adenylyltransferase [Planctomycetes bacterium]|nr:nicotinate (nicotinamide) nucleotide adenylyltransferase [Planctomycetota bacterium]